MTDLIGNFARSWRLVKASFEVLRADEELLILPAISGVASAIVVGTFAWQMMMSDAFAPTANNSGALSLWLYVWLFALYVVQYSIVIFFNTALVGAALARLEGGDPTVRSALALAASRIVPILGYAIVSATVGVLLRAIAERSGLLGRLIAGGVGLAWTVATFLVVPVLAVEGIGPIKAIEKSAGLLRDTWGENIVGTAGISTVLGLVVAVVAVPFFFGGGALLGAGNQALGIPLLAAGVVLLLTVMLFGAALTGIYSAAVYYYAAIGEPPRNFDRDMIRGAFTRKGN